MLEKKEDYSLSEGFNSGTKRFESYNYFVIIEKI